MAGGTARKRGASVVGLVLVLGLGLVLSISAAATAFLHPPRAGGATLPPRAPAIAGGRRRWGQCNFSLAQVPKAGSKLEAEVQVQTETEDSHPEHATAGFAESVDVAELASTPPAFLPWTVNALEEEKELNFLINTAIFVGIAFVVFLKVTLPTLGASRGWTAEETLLRLPIDNFRAYSSTLRDHPIFVKALTSGTVYMLGDWTAQSSQGSTLADLDRGRILRAGIAGLIGHGPLSHFWYQICDGFFESIGWNSLWWVVFPKVTVDQLMWGPIWNGLFVTFQGVLKGDGLSKVVQAVRSTSLPLLRSGLKLWVPAHLITYGLIPQEHRLLYVDMVEILWVSILSRQAADEAREQQTAGH